MRLRSDIFVSALVRRVFGLGGFAAVARRGMDQAGAIFIRQRFRDGTETLFAPAPQSLAIEAEDQDYGRLFEIRLQRAQAGDVEALMARETRFDGDLWLVEIELDDIGDLVPLSATQKT